MEIRLKDIPVHARLRCVQGVKAEKRTYSHAQARSSVEISH
jgi:hypothetical protein